jgi:hypothetical protein
MPPPGPAADLTFDPIVNAPAAKPAHENWKEYLQVGRRDVLVFALGLVIGLAMLGVGLLAVWFFTSRNTVK